MTLLIKDRVKETCTGTNGVMALTGAVSGFLAFDADATFDGNTTYYALKDADGTKWEVGLGTLSADSTVLTRTTILATQVNLTDTSTQTFSGGTHTIFCTYPAGKAVYLDASGAFNADTVTNGVYTTDTIPVSQGGTGATSLLDNCVLTGGSTINAETWIIATDQYGGDFTLQSSTGNSGADGAKPVLMILNTNTDEYGGTLNFSKQPSTSALADGDIIGNVDFYSSDSGSGSQVYGRILGKIGDVTAGSEQGSIEFYVAEYDGTLTKGMDIVGLDSDGNITVDISTHDGAAGGLKLGGTLVTATAAELNYVYGVSSAIQTQLDNKPNVTLVTTSHNYLSISTQAITLGEIDIGDDTNLAAGTGITLTGDTLSTTDGDIVHDNLSGFVANEHLDWTASVGTIHASNYTDTTTNTMGSGFTVSATTDTNATTITETDDLFFAAGAGITCETTADGTVTITNTVSDTNTMGSGFVLEDGDGTEVTITENKEVKFIEGAGIDIDWTDVDNGTDADPYDLTFTVDHDAASNFVANEHINHTSVEIASGTGLSGGGDLTSTRTLSVDASQTQITAVGTLTGLVISDGGNIGSATDTDAIAIGADGGVTLSKAIIGPVGAGVLSGSDTDLTVDWSTGNYHEVTLNTDSIDAIIFNYVTIGQRIILRIQNDDAAVRGITWTVTSSTSASPASATVSWPGGTAPTMTATVDKADTYGFICRSATTFDGFVIGQNI